MALRIPTPPDDRPPHHLLLCEDVLLSLRRTCGPILDREALFAWSGGDPDRIRYARDTLGMFSKLGQVEHVRRDLWIIDPERCPSPGEEELLRAACAVRAGGQWSVVGGAWALVLAGVLSPERFARPGLRFVLTPRPARLSTHCVTGTRLRDELGDEVRVPANEARHVCLIRGAPIATIARPTERLGAVRYIERGGLGCHVLQPADALISMLEHPRVAGGVEAARKIVLPLMGTIGLHDVLEVGARHPKVAVRRRLAFVLVDGIRRSEGTTTWFGPDEWGIVDDEQLWRVQRALDVRLGTRWTVLDPHRLPIGRRDRMVWVVDNRQAPILRPVEDAGTVAQQVARHAARRRREVQAWM